MTDEEKLNELVTEFRQLNGNVAKPLNKTVQSALCVMLFWSG